MITLKDLTETFIGDIYVYEDSLENDPHAIVDADSAILDLIGESTVLAWTVRCHSKKPLINVVISLVTDEVPPTDDDPTDDNPGTDSGDDTPGTDDNTGETGDNTEGADDTPTEPVEGDDVNG